MGLQTIPVDKLDNQLSIRRLDLGEKRDVCGVRAEGVDVLKFRTLGSSIGFCAVLVESRRVREKARVGFRGSINGDIWVLPDLAIVLIQRRHGKA